MPLFLVVGFGLSTLGAFIISTTVGLFDVKASWDGFYPWAAAVSEVVVIIAGLFAARAEGYLSSLREAQHRHPVGREHHVGLDSVGAQRDGEAERRERVLGPVARGTTVPDDARSPHVTDGPRATCPDDGGDVNRR